jgi:hydroxymethylpyrimidine pyrophosphatase-like HAD family hydrolase
MSRIRMLVSDVDGTLVTPDNRLTSATTAAVRGLPHHGILFTLTSSRPAFGLRGLCKHLIPIFRLDRSTAVRSSILTCRW